MKNLMTIAKLAAAVGVLALLVACSEDTSGGEGMEGKEAGAAPTSSSSENIRQNANLGGNGGGHSADSAPAVE